MKADPSPTPITHTRHLHADGTDACLNFALWEIPVPNDGLPSLAIASVRILG